MYFRRYLAFLILFFILALPVRAAESNILILFDASGSMKDNFGGISRIDAAKNAVRDVVAVFDNSVLLGLRGYAHIAQYDKTSACTVTELLQPFSTDHQSIVSKVNDLQAVGSYTPTAYALRKAASDFTPGVQNTLILLTDGLETCGGDPVAAAQALCEAGIQVKSYVVGLGVDAQARSQLQSVASAGCGKYFDATDAISLANSLKSISIERGIDKTNTDTFDTKIVHGGSGFQTAVPLDTGSYQLDHHQRPSEFDYFILKLQEGVPLKLSIQNSEFVAQYNKMKDIFTINKSLTPYAAFYLHQTDRSRITYFQVNSVLQKSSMYVLRDQGVIKYSDRGSDEYKEPTVVVQTIDPGILYFLVGNRISSQNKDVIFTIQKVKNTPAYTATPTTATPTSVVSSIIPTPTASVDTTIDADNTSNKQIPWTLIIGAVVVLGIVGLGVWFALRKGGSNLPPANLAPPPPPPPIIPNP
ncbi:MAG TPA: VWA domain-containing protein [Candidatus Paceibacterota bacterium]